MQAFGYISEEVSAAVALELFDSLPNEGGGCCTNRKLS